MEKLDWYKVYDLSSQKSIILTKSGIPFHILEANENSIKIKVKSGEEHNILRKNLEKAVSKINEGLILKGPNDYRKHIADNRPSYAWAILKKLGLII